MKRLLTIIFATMLAGQAWAQKFQSGDLYYRIISDSTVKVTYQNWENDNYSDLTTIDIPEIVNNNDVNYSVVSIGYGAFYGCHSLVSVTIPSTVVSIDNSAFYECDGLRRAEFASIESYCNILFDGLDSNPLYYAGHLYINGEEITELTIPDSITNIKQYAFSGCSGLTSITIPISVTSIGDCAFYGCSSLTTATIPNTVTSIGKSAFNGCNSLTSIVIPNTVTSISHYAFYGCSSLTSVTIPNTVTSIGESAFNSCSGLTSIVIPNTVTSISNYAFYGCSSLTSVTIPNSVTSIGLAFYECNNLQYNEYGNAYYLGNSDNHFLCLIKAKSTDVTSCEISNDCKIIADGAFDGCSLAIVTMDNDIIGMENVSFIKDGIRYAVLNRKEVKVVSRPWYNPYSGDIVIPDSIVVGNTFKVTSIG
ncbi:MAG: leucine-rich repeat domain-containing protein, partial [Salinivirgaceae bacterium]|nr:leucine-rich repeat domain-containing protein [Salinivirgaceae bacterium]